MALIKQAALGKKQLVSCTFHMALRGGRGRRPLLWTTNRPGVLAVEPYFPFISDQSVALKLCRENVCVCVCV